MQNINRSQNEPLKKPINKLGISKNVFIMGLVSFFNDIASEMIYPLVPLFLTTILGTPVSIIGIIEGLAESTGSLLKFFSGWVSDKLQKRLPFVFMGYGLGAISKLFLGFAYTWHLVLFAKFIDRSGKGIRTSARDALISASTLQEKKATAFGFHRALDTCGAIIGPLLAIAFLKTSNDNFRLIFLIAFIPCFLGILLLFFVKEKKKNPLAWKKLTLNLKTFSHSFKTFVLVSAIFAIGNSSDAFLILRTKNLGFSIILTIFAYITYNITYALFSTPAGIVSDRIGTKKTLITGFLIFSVVYLLFGLTDQAKLLWILFPTYGIYMALTDGIGKAHIAKFVPDENLGSAFGVYQTITGICTFGASTIAGLLWTYVSVPAPFIFGSVMALSAGLAFAILG